MKLTLTGKKYGVDVGLPGMEKIKACDDYFYDIRKEQYNGLTERLAQVPGVTFVDYDPIDPIITIDIELDDDNGQAHEIILGIICTAIARGTSLLSTYADIGT